jgi:hypothetical protein
VLVLTAYPPEAFPAQQVLERHRPRWQVTLVFRRSKSIAQLGHLPKYDGESGNAWLHGKLLAALLKASPDSLRGTSAVRMRVSWHKGLTVSAWP